MPERMKVTAAPKQADALVGDKVAFDVAAQYLFGGSAVDSGVELDVHDRAGDVPPDARTPTSRYGDRAEGQAGHARRGAKDQLDPARQDDDRVPRRRGRRRRSRRPASSPRTSSVLEAGSGRATVKTATMTVHPEKYYLGLQDQGDAGARRARRSPSRAWSSTGTASSLPSAVDTVDDRAAPPRGRLRLRLRRGQRRAALRPLAARGARGQAAREGRGRQVHVRRHARRGRRRLRRARHGRQGEDRARARRRRTRTTTTATATARAAPTRRRGPRDATQLAARPRRRTSRSASRSR